MINRATGRAMLNQLERVNGDTVARLESEINRLNAVIAKKDRIIAELTNALFDGKAVEIDLDHRSGKARATVSETADGVYMNGERVITLAEAQKRAGVSQPTAWRYVAGRRKHWRGYQDSSGQWWVYADQPLTRRNK